MKTLLKTLALTLLVCSVTAANAKSAAAANRYAVAKVSNPLNTTITYQYRWGNGPWKMRILSPGTTIRHSWRYQFVGQDKSPRLQIRLDADLGSSVFMLTYTLQKYAVPYRTLGGKKYRFEYAGLGRILKLTYLN